MEKGLTFSHKLLFSMKMFKMYDNLTKSFKNFLTKKVPTFVKEHFFDLKEPSNEDNTCYNVVMAAINDSNSKLIYSPEDSGRGIIWNTYGISILIEHRLIIICKNSTSKRCLIDNTKLYNDICNAFDVKVKEDLEKIYNDIRKADERFFETILF